MGKFEDLTGNRYNKVTVVKRIENFEGEAGDSRAQWLCRCDCGKTVVIVGRSLKRSKYASCHACSVGHGGNTKYERNVNGFLIRVKINK